MAWSFNRLDGRRELAGKWYARVVFNDDDAHEELVQFKFNANPSAGEITARVTIFLGAKNAPARWSARLVISNNKGDSRTIFLPLASDITLNRVRNLVSNLSDVLQTEAQSDA